ncbi:MAG: DUF3737 family protein [Opitutales bacterium]|nr:DUF3737 family protein [Opitutales bacterium]
MDDKKIFTVIANRQFGGERPLFGLKDSRLESLTVVDGESAVKQCENIVVADCKFFGKYPLWHVKGSLIERCYFAAGSRSAVWYSDDMTMRDCVIDGPKFFREMNGLTLENVVIKDADEVFWRVNGLRAKNLVLKGGTYPFMFCRDLEIDGLDTDSNYVFQYCKNLVLRNARINTKDALWECEDVTIYDSELSGEYLAWHSKNVRLVRCRISGEQVLCYAKNLQLEDCSFDASCDRVFEYSDVCAEIRGSISNIKNPLSGRIVADKIGSVTYDEFLPRGADCKIEERKAL